MGGHEEGGSEEELTAAGPGPAGSPGAELSQCGRSFGDKIESRVYRPYISCKGEGEIKDQRIQD